jgi:hypothetical protein
MNDVLAALDLPPAIEVQPLKLMAHIIQAASPDELCRASDRAAGFVLVLETVEALEAVRIKALYEYFDRAATARRQEDAQ